MLGSHLFTCERLSDYDLIIIPGGGGKKICNGLGESGKDSVRNYLCTATDRHARAEQMFLIGIVFLSRADGLNGFNDAGNGFVSDAVHRARGIQYDKVIDFFLFSAQFDSQKNVA